MFSLNEGYVNHSQNMPKPRLTSLYHSHLLIKRIHPWIPVGCKDPGAKSRSFSLTLPIGTLQLNEAVSRVNEALIETLNEAKRR